jgi:hypothetical protein
VFDGEGPIDRNILYVNGVKLSEYQDSSPQTSLNDDGDGVGIFNQSAIILGGYGDAKDPYNVWETFSRDNFEGQLYDVRIFGKSLTAQEAASLFIDTDGDGVVDADDTDVDGDGIVDGSGTYDNDQTINQTANYGTNAVTFTSNTNEILSDVEVDAEEMVLGQQTSTHDTLMNMRGTFRSKRLKLHSRGRFKLFKNAVLKLTEKIEAHSDATLTFNGEVEAPEMVGNLMTEDGGAITINVVEGDVTLRKSHGWFAHIKGKLFMKEKGRVRVAQIDGDVDVDGDNETILAADLINGNVDIISGRVEPGDSPGITVVTGNYTQSANGVLQIVYNFRSLP